MWWRLANRRRFDATRLVTVSHVTLRHSNRGDVARRGDPCLLLPTLTSSSWYFDCLESPWFGFNI